MHGPTPTCHVSEDFLAVARNSVVKGVGRRGV